MYMSDIGVWIDRFLTGYVTRVVSELCGYLWPLGVAMLTLYVANYGLAVLRGEVSEPMEVFAWKIVKLGITMTVALSAGFYLPNISSAFESVQNGMATVLVSSAGGFDTYTTSSGAFGALDVAFAKGVKALDDIWSAVSITSLDLLVAGIVYTIGLDIFTFVAGAMTIFARVFLAFALAIGPAAVLCLMFKPTAKFFDAWVGFALSACVMTWFVFFALGLSLYVVDRILGDLKDHGAFNPAAAGPDLISPIDGSIAMIVIYLLMAVLIWQAPRLASALTGGPAMSTGTSMAVSYLLGHHSRGGGGKSGGAGSGGGAVEGGAGAAYGAGRAAGYSFQRVSGLFGGRR
jgi:type IV secretion system protein VirB6